MATKTPTWVTEMDRQIADAARAADAEAEAADRELEAA
jgi:hypothetical protein